MNDLKNKPILFMGSPDFAVPSLEALINEGYNVSAVVTQPDKPQGRGYKLTPQPVKVCALAHNIPVYQPEKLKKVFFEETLKEINPAMIVVAAFGKILYPYIIKYPEFGCINVHGSLLPKYRGAAPMQRVIINGEKETGVTIMQMDTGLDTGDMLYSASVEIGENDNFEVIHDRLADTGAKALIHTLSLIDEGKAVRTKQDDSLSTYAEKIENSDCEIDFHKDAEEIHNQIRGLSPIPLAYTSLKGKKLKIISSVKIDDVSVSDGTEAGTVVRLDNGVIAVACGRGVIGITGVLPEGKRRMSAFDFINGRGISVGDVLGEK